MRSRSSSARVTLLYERERVFRLRIRAADAFGFREPLYDYNKMSNAMQCLQQNTISEH